MRLVASSRLVALLLAALAPSLALGGEGSNAPVGEVRLPSGLAAHYEYHYDRNALRDSRRAGDALIALTRAGGLLRFDAGELKPTAEWFGPVAATCLGGGEGDPVLVGFADGRVGRVDPATLAIEPVARVEGAVRWVGGSPGGLVVVAEPTTLRAWSDGVRRPTKLSVVHDLASGKSYRFTQARRDPGSGREVAWDRQASAFLLDSRRRLWAGDDRGEWGGWCARVDLGAGSVAEVEGVKDAPEDETPGWDGVYGFAELPDGRVWAFGGTMHMGFTRGFIRRVDGPTAEPLYLYGNADARRGHEDDAEVPDPGRPFLPVTHVLPDRDGQLLVLSYSRSYRVDPDLKAWSRGPTLRIRYRSGRPDAVGSYPSIVAVHRLGDRLLHATAVDGYVEVVAGREIPHALPGQLGLDQVQRIVGSADGTLLLPRDAEEPPWRHDPDGWRVAPLAPPFEPGPGEPRAEGAQPSWHETRALVGPGGTVATVSASGWTPGTRTTARRVGGRWEVLGREESALDVDACFITPDGTLWNAGRGALLRFADGAWAEAKGGNASRVAEVGRGLHALGDAGPPWLLLDRDNSRLLRLTHGPGFAAPRLDAVGIVEGAAPSTILDAIPWSKGELLLATDRGLRRLDVATDRTRDAGLPAPAGPVATLARDGLGRLWLGGEGLWVVDGDGDGGRLHDAGSLPMIGRTAVATMAADPEQRDGVLLSLGPRGVVSVRAAPGP